MKTQVIIDADFLNIFLSIENGGNLFIEIMKALECEPIIHEYVEKNELFEDKAKKLLENKYIRCMTYDEIFKKPYYKEIYEETFKKFYSYINNDKTLELGKCNLYNYRKAGENLGEIHSCVMSMFLEIEYFMSNDRGAKDLAITRVNSNKFEMTVLSFSDFFDFLINNKGKLSNHLKQEIIDKLLPARNSNGNYILTKQRSRFIKTQLKG